MKVIYTILVLLQAMVIQAQVKDIDGNVYKTIKIGSQIWMAENLATTRFKNGDYISPIIENNQWSQWHLPAWTFYPYEKGPNPAGLKVLKASALMVGMCRLIKNGTSLKIILVADL
jgi:hypothetical protein